MVATLPNDVFLPFAPDKPWLAPLAGWSDLPFRLLCRRFGAAVCCTEMISAKGLIYKSPGTAELFATCPEANYFFTYGAEICVLKLFWRIIPAPLLYGLPAPLILAGYMYAVCALSRLTRGAEEVPFS